MSNYAYILEEARAEYAKNPNWMDFSNKFFGNGNPYVPKDPAKRKEFLNSPEYQEIQDMKNQLEKAQPDVTASTEKEYSGNISLRVPKSLHRSLVEEAEVEGVSLNQLILAKISISLNEMTRYRR